ncbi:unnamed protein product, partial [marine sediment metagenome]
PIGLIFYDDLDRLAEAAHDQGRITHRDGRCSAGAVAVAGAVAIALRDRPVQAGPFIRKLGGLLGRYDRGFASCLEQLEDWVHLEPAEAVGPISGAGLWQDFQAAWDGISPFVIGSVLWSLYSFLRTPGDYWETVCTAISCGGDVDTTAAMAGAISGAHLGLSAIPAELSGRLTDQGGWGLERLRELARRCHQIISN